MSPRKHDALRDGDEALRAAFRGRPAESASPDGCPSAADVWSAVRGELSAEERRAIVSHTASCAACAEAWRLALDVTPDPLPVAAATRPSAFAGLPWPSAFAPLAAAAALVMALGAGFWLLRPPVPVATPGFRGGDAPAIRSLLREDQALPREDFRLRWSPGPEGSRYDVRVTTESLQVLATVQRLAETSYLVPETALRSLPPGSRLLWRVEAVLPDGERAASPTYITRLR